MLKKGGPTNNPNGRPKGVPNKTNTFVKDRLKDLNVNLVDEMIEIAQFGMAQMRNTKLDPEYRSDGAKISNGVYKELMKYCSPQLKAVEITGIEQGPITNITWLPPESDDQIPQSSKGMSMDELADDTPEE